LLIVLQFFFWCISLKSTAIVALVFVAIVIVALMLNPQILNPQLESLSVLCIDLIPVPVTEEIQPMQWSPPKPYDVKADVVTEIKLVRPNILDMPWQKDIEIINGTKDAFKLYGIDLILTLTLEVYSSNDTLILRRALTFDGGMERTIKIYRTDFQALQPLRVILEINIKLLYGGSTIFEKTFTVERDGITIQ